MKSLKTSKKEEVKEVKKEIFEQDKNNSYVDTKNSIRTITAKENKIYIQFNKIPQKKNIRYKLSKYKKTYANIFDIKGQFKYIIPTVLKLKGIDRIIVGKYTKNSIRIRILDRQKHKVNYDLSKKLLTITINPYNTLPYKNFKRKTIVIDAGHGAHDVGAVGPHRRYEKTVTLKIARYLSSLLKQRGHKVYLTRYRDRFIKVVHRTKLANRKKADIFISIHANSVHKSRAKIAHGIETFFLSPARSERAKRVAAKENRSDINKMSSSSKNAFLESLNRPRITASHKLAIDVQAGLLQSVHSKYKDVKDSGVREGPFWVLVGAQMPSILIEVGYISHPLESKRLYSTYYQKLLAKGIAGGVDSYFSKNP